MLGKCKMGKHFILGALCVTVPDRLEHRPVMLVKDSVVLFG